MYVFVWPELAELQTVRRSVRLTVVGAVWLGELLPHGFSKRSWSKPSLAHKPSHPLPLPHTRACTYAPNGWIDEVRDRLPPSLGTNRKMTPTWMTRVTDSLTNQSHTTSENYAAVSTQPDK